MSLPNLVREMDALRAALGLESALRDAAGEELEENNLAGNTQPGPLRIAHDAIYQKVIDLAKLMTDKVTASA